MTSLRESRQGEEKRAQDRTRKNSKQDKKETEKQTNKEEIGRKEGGEYEGAQGKTPGGPNVAAPHEKMLSLPFKVCALGHSSWGLCLKHIVFSVTNVCIYTPFFSQNVSHELENTSVSLCETA